MQNGPFSKDTNVRVHWLFYFASRVPGNVAGSHKARKWTRVRTNILKGLAIRAVIVLAFVICFILVSLVLELLSKVLLAMTLAGTGSTAGLLQELLLLPGDGSSGVVHFSFS